MIARTLALVVAGLLSAPAGAIPGEKGGAYGGGTRGDAIEVTMKNGDTDGDGVLNREEARRLGIEEFEAVDRNGDGVLDAQELAAVESDRPMNPTGEADRASQDAPTPPTTAGEKAGAYGGGTSGDATEVSLEHADDNGDGVLSRTEARAVGIERFDAADQNRDGVLDEAELAALETPAQRQVPDQVGEPVPKNQSPKATETPKP